MDEAYYIGIYWQANSATASECATQLAFFLQRLTQQDVIFKEWYQTAKSRTKAISLPVQAEKHILEDLLSKRSHDSGCNLKLWTGKSDRESATISFRCGCNDKRMFANPNSCLIELPLDGNASAHVLRLDVLVNIMKIGIDVWQPDHIIVNSSDFLKSFIERGNSLARIGWLTYLQTNHGYLPEVGSDFHVERLYGGYLISTKNRLSAKDPNHVQIMLTGAEKIAKYLSS